MLSFGGTLSQKAGSTGYNAQVVINWGKLRLRSLSVELPGSVSGKTVKVAANGRAIEAKGVLAGTRLTITLNDWLELGAQQKLEVAVG